MILQMPEHGGPTGPTHALQIAFQLLCKAWQYSVEAKTDPWQFAIEISEFYRAGVTKSELRWLIAHRYALPAEEVTLPLKTKRQFKALKNILLPENSCFILSDLGAAILKSQIVRQHKITRTAIKISHDNGARPPKQIETLAPPALLPHWDSTLRVLRVGKTIVKRFRTRALNQEKVISAFHESGWPRRIEDPLHRPDEQDPRRRLNATIRSLNRNQTNNLLRFLGDGTATGILWEFCTANQS